MGSTTEIQSIASESAREIVEKFLQSFPSELENQLPQDFCYEIGKDLQADIQLCLHSRLQWSMQAAQAEIVEQKRQHLMPQPHHQINFLPPQPLQKLSERESQSQKRSQHAIPQSTVLDNPVYPEKAETDDSYIDEAQPQQRIIKSPNRQRRRRRSGSNNN